MRKLIFDKYICREINKSVLDLSIFGKHWYGHKHDTSSFWQSNYYFKLLIIPQLRELSTIAVDEASSNAASVPDMVGDVIANKITSDPTEEEQSASQVKGA